MYVVVDDDVRRAMKTVDVLKKSGKAGGKSIHVCDGLSSIDEVFHFVQKWSRDSIAFIVEYDLKKMDISEILYYIIGRDCPSVRRLEIVGVSKDNAHSSEMIKLGATWCIGRENLKKYYLKSM